MKQEYNDYSEKLIQYIKSNVMILIIVVCIFVIFSFILYLLFKEKKIFIYLALSAVLLCLFVYITSIFPYQYDIKNNGYEEYIGDFFVEQSNYYGSRGGPSYILIRTNNKTKSVRYIYAIDSIDVKDNTYYHGKIVWSERSKVLVDFNAIKTAED